MSERALNEVFRPAGVQKKAQAQRGWFRDYAVRRLRQMAFSWMMMAALGVGANMAFQRYAQEKYGIDLQDQLAALDEVSGGVLGLSALIGDGTGSGATVIASDVSMASGQTPGLGGLDRTGARRILVPQSGN
ncbi:hypothetical protein [Roseivivax sp. CAU 1753]